MEVQGSSDSLSSKSFDENLDALVRPVQDEKGELSDADFKELHADLHKMVGTSDIALGKVLKRYEQLPSQLIVPLIVRVWPNLRDDSKQLIRSKLLKDLPKLTSPKAQELRLRVSVGLANIDPQEARRLITVSVRISLTGKEKIPSSPFCALFKQLLLGADQVLIKKIPFPRSQEERNLLALCALKSCIRVNKKKTVSDPREVVPLLQWLSSNDFHFDSHEKTCFQLQQSMAKWPKDFEKDCQWVSTYLGLQALASNEPESTAKLPQPKPPAPQAKEPPKRQVSGTPSEKKEVPGEQPQEVVLGLGEMGVLQSGDVNLWALREAISRVSYYAQAFEDSLNAQLVEHKNKTEALQRTLGTLQKELLEKKNALSITIQSREDLSNRITELQTQVSRWAAREKQLMEDKELQASEIQRLRDKCLKLDGERKSLETQKDELVSRVKTEAEFQVRVFKNQVQEALKHDFLEMNELAKMDMTTDLGIHYRSQMKNVFAKLKALGIFFGGDPHG